MKFNVFSRQQWKLIQKGVPPDQARLIAYKTQQRQGNLVPGTFQLNDRGRQISELNPGQRAILRRARATGKNPSDYIYKEGKVLLKDANRIGRLPKNRL